MRAVPLPLPLPLVILAGGQSRRMGEPKALLPFGKSDTLIHYHEKQYQPYFKNLYLCTKEHILTKHHFSSSLILDNTDVSSPLVGLLRALSHLKKEIMFISVDTPFISPQVFYRLYLSYKTHKAGQYSLFIGRKGTTGHNLCGIIKASTAPILKHLIDNQTYKIKYFLETTPTYYLNINANFFNMNTPKDYHRGYIKALRENRV